MINAKVRRTSRYSDGSDYLEVHIKKSEYGNLPVLQDKRVSVSLIARDQQCTAGLRMTADNDYVWISPDVYINEEKYRLADFLLNINATPNSDVLLEYKGGQLFIYNTQEFISSLKKGIVLNNEDLSNIFLCSTQGGMRRSLKTNTLVIVSNHVKSIYDDRWINDIFYYTGMGMKGDQSLAFAQNKTLAESNLNGVDIHLFEVFVEREYQYIGQVQLSDTPYFESQLDENNTLRQACIFPLRLKDGSVPSISLEYALNPFEQKAKKARKLSDEDVKRRAQNARKFAGSRITTNQQFDRDPWVIENAKREANGICQLCEKPAPFANSLSEPYLETHHIIWLSKGGEDTIKNTVALCPNCHRKLHVLDDQNDINYLKNKKQR